MACLQRDKPILIKSDKNAFKLFVHLFVYSIFEFCVIPVLLKPV